MELVITILALWIVPGILAYAIASLYSKDWTINDKDVVLIVPILNIVMLAFVILITAESLLDRLINWIYGNKRKWKQ